MPTHVPVFRTAIILAASLVFVASGTAAAGEVPLPLRFDHALVEKVLVEDVFTGPDQSLIALKDGSGCNYLILSDPVLRGVDGLLRVRSAAKGRVATAIGTRCLVLLSARYDIVDMLAATPQAPDPVPELFVRTWDRLAPVLREVQTGLPGEAALQY